MFCKYKTNIAKRKKQSANTLFFITKPSLYLIYLLYPSLSPLSYLSTLSYLYPSISSIPPPEQQEEGQSIRT